VKGALAKEGVVNCCCVIAPPECSGLSNRFPDDFEGYFSSIEVYKDCEFHGYASSIDSFPDSFFDLVAVDGRARPSCIYHARRKVKIGGYLMLDNSERAHYQRAKELLSDWEKHEFYGPGPYNYCFSETTIWKRSRSDPIR
jgi:hypothetical protein